MIMKTWLKYPSNKGCYGVVIVKVYGDLNTYMVGDKARNEVLWDFFKVVFEKFPKNCYWDYNHWSIYMFE